MCQIITVVLNIVGAPEFESGLYHPKWYVLPLHHAPMLVGVSGIEPETFRVSDECSNLIELYSYHSRWHLLFKPNRILK